MTRIQPPTCPTCKRAHWELMSTRTAAHHAHIGNERFRQVIKAGKGPAPWVHCFYEHPRYHVDVVDAWMRATAERSAA